ncbi:MAG: sugar ABC transporter permease YjfF [Saccharofermentans sp.]|nr:sugar ABC transporter permease YjfF [Saccharofermentans sp.]
MSVNTNALGSNKLKKRASITDTNLLLIITIAVFIVMYVCAILFLKKGFTKPQMFFNILNENASLLVLSCGMTLVMITGGIDISVGQVTCLVCMSCAVYLQKVDEGLIKGNVFTSVLIALAIGLAFGIVQGFLVAYMEFQPFIVTLAGLFFAKGMTTIVSSDRISVTYKPFVDLCRTEVNVPFLGSYNKLKVWVPAYVEVGVIVALLVVIVLFCVLRWTKLGRNFYAVGGNNQSANMLGINVKLTKFLAHVLCGLCAGIGGYLFFLHACSGSPLHAQGAEMNAIASSIIGGTLLSGGVGNIIGTLFGVLSLSTIKNIVTSLGLEDAWWTNITVGVMLCIFLLVQSVILARKNKNKK